MKINVLLKSLMLGVVLTGCLMMAGTLQAQVKTPKSVWGTIVNANGSNPAKAAIQITSYIASRPAEILTEANATAIALDADPGSGILYYGIECASFGTQWQANDELVIEVRNTVISQVRTQRVVLNGTPDQMVDIQLQQPAAVAPTWLTQPQSLTNLVGTTALFSASAAGTAPLTYQWRKNSTPITGSNAMTLTLSSVQLADASNYDVVVSNAGGSITSAVAVLTVWQVPGISSQPQSTNVNVGANVTLSVTAAGVPMVGYQWRKNGTSIPTANGSTYPLNNIQTGNAGNYDVVVANAAGSITSSVAVVTVNAAASLAVGPTSQDFGVVAAGSSAERTFYVTNSGGGTLVGIASVSTPFSIVSGGAYTLSGAQWQAVVVRYAPTVAGTHNGLVTFTGGTGTSRPVSGTSPTVGTQLTFTGATVAGAQNGEVLMPVQVSNFNGVNLFQFSMHWNPALVVYLGAESFGLPGMAAGNFGTSQTNVGTLTVSWDDADLSGETLTNGATVFALRFRLLTGPGSTNEVVLNGTPTAVEAADRDLNSMVAQVVNGQLIVPATAVLSGTVNYYDLVKPLAGVELDVTGVTNQTVISGGDGTYRAVVLAGHNYQVTPRKTNDNTANNLVVTTLDIALIRRHILNPGTPALMLDSPYKVLAADVNGTRSVSTLDIALVRKVVLQFTNTFPAGLWRFVPADYVFADPVNPWDAPTNRTHTNLWADTERQNWVAVRYGDVNNSWTTGGSGLVGDKVATLTETTGPAVRFQVGNALGMTGGRVKVLVSASGFTKVTSAQFTLKWNPAALRLVELGDFGLPELSEGNFAPGDGNVSVSWDDPSAVGVDRKDGTALFSLSFEPLGRAGEWTGVEWSDAVAAREVGVAFAPGVFQGTGGKVLVLGGESARALGSVVGGEGFEVRVQTVVGVNYVLERTEQVGGAWTAVMGLAGDGKERVLVDSEKRSTKRFYRVRMAL
jgi:hypothetical protein